MDLVIAVLALTLLAVAANRWGIDSADGVDSSEWERRRAWRASHGSAQSSVVSRRSSVQAPSVDRETATR